MVRPSLTGILTAALLLPGGLRAEQSLAAVSLTGGDPEILRRRLDGALENPEVKDRLATHPSSHTLVAYVLPQNYMMQHLIVDLGEHEAHHGGGDDSGAVAMVKHLFNMYMLKPMRQLRAGAPSLSQRVIFTMVETVSGEPVPLERALAVDVLRLPLFFTDLEVNRAVMTMDTPPRHSWGNIPVPAF